MPHSIRPGDVLADRYTMVDLLSESGSGLFYRAHDRVLARHVAFHVIDASDERAPQLLEAARRSARVVDARILRVLDADQRDDVCYVVNEWGSGRSLDNLLDEGPLPPRHAAWIVAEVASTIARAHEAGVTHGRLVPENVLIDHNGTVKIIGFAVDAALHGIPEGRRSTDVVDLAGVLYAALVGKWPGVSRSRLPGAPIENGQPLRPRKVRAGIPKPLDLICEQVLSPYVTAGGGATGHLITSAADIRDALNEYVGDASDLASSGSTGPVPRADRPDAPSAPAAAPEPDPEHTQAMPAITHEPADADLTEAMPGILDPEWRTPRATPPPAPTPEPPAAKPLFAEDSVRRPRADAPTGPPTSPSDASDTAGSAEFWPWGADGPSTGTGRQRPVSDDPEEPVPGPSWLRLAWTIGAVALILVAVTLAFTLGRDRGDREPADTGSGTGDTATSKIVTPEKVEDFDPEGDPPDEYPELVALVTDGKPDTSWHTSTYDQQLGPQGLKDGVGVLLDLGRATTVTTVDVSFVESPTSAELYVLDRKPAGMAGLQPAARGTASGTSLTLTPDGDARGRYVIVWLTKLPRPGGFRGGISEIVIRS